jgi:hypothetical protein
VSAFGRLRAERAATAAQFARNGAWEQAFAVDPQVPDAQALARYLDGAGEIAFEAFFGEAFFGVRRTGSAAEVAAFAQACVRALPDDGGSPFLSRLAQAIGVPAADARCVLAEVGCVNAWRSVGSVGAPFPFATARDTEAFIARVAASPVWSDTTHAKAIEFGFEAPLPHWIALPVSDALPPYAPDLRRLRRAIEEAGEALPGR